MGGKYRRVKIVGTETLDFAIMSLNRYMKIVETPNALYRENNLQVNVRQFLSSYLIIGF